MRIISPTLSAEEPKKKQIISDLSVVFDTASAALSIEQRRLFHHFGQSAVIHHAAVQP